ncbi:MAG: alpha/beta fold hydrolase, partial [Anaerolineales bacterium]
MDQRKSAVRKNALTVLLLVALLAACGLLKPAPPAAMVPPTDTAVTESAASGSTETSATPQVGDLESFHGDMAAFLGSLGGYPCPNSVFTCLDVTVPLDHTNPSGGTTGVVFAVLPASGERKGMFIIANGGPGVSGVLSADSYVSYYDESITQHFDIVFFDQRGVGLSGGLQCPRAALNFYRADWDASTPAREELLLDSAQRFAAACVQEMGNPDILPYLGTQQAIQDLELFRSLTGEEQFWLYGESYGSQFAQSYTAAYPEHLAGLILDGTVDLTLSGTEFLDGQARAFNQVLEETLQDCNQDEACAAAMGEDALVVYDRLADRLKQSPLAYDFPLPSGGLARRMLAFSDLETAAYAWDGNLVPLARVLYDALLVDPRTEQAILAPSNSDAVYYAVECQDYSFFSGTTEERALAYLRAGDELDASLPHFASVFYGNLPCVFWPNASQDEARPEPLTAEGVTSLVLNATSD